MQSGARRGMMLIEAIVALLVVALVAALVTFSLRFAVRKARTDKAIEECAMLLSACRTYHALVDEWPKASRQQDVIAHLVSPQLPRIGRPLVKADFDLAGKMIDPWRSPYVIEIPQEGVLVYSFGSDRDSDMGHFEGDGCAEGVHEALGLPEPVDDVRPVGVHHRDTEAQR